MRLLHIPTQIKFDLIESSFDDLSDSDSICIYNPGGTHGLGVKSDGLGVKSDYGIPWSSISNPHLWYAIRVLKIECIPIGAE